MIPVTRYYTQYKGVYYRYIPVDDGIKMKGIWKLSDTYHECGLVMEFNADEMRIDQCLAAFDKALVSCYMDHHYLQKVNEAWRGLQAYMSKVSPQELEGMMDMINKSGIEYPYDQNEGYRL